MKRIFTVLGFIALSSTAAHAQIVISEVYGGGGNAGAPYIDDYVELKNIGTTSATLTGASLQYASATGNFNAYAALPSITLAAGQKYLIEMVPSTANTVGAALPTADFKVTSNVSYNNGNTYQGGFNIAAASGKVALAKDLTQVTSATGSNVQDFVGFGTANMYEGAGAAPTLDATSSATRTAGDTNNNAVDFTKQAPNPQNTLGTTEVGLSKHALIKNTVVADKLSFATKSTISIIDATGKVVKTASVDNNDLDVSALPKGIYFVKGTANGEQSVQKFIKK